MPQTPASGPFDQLRRFFEDLSYPKLLILTAGLFVVDLFALDPIPFADEILLGLLTLLLSRLKDRKKEPPPEPAGWKDVTPKG